VDISAIKEAFENAKVAGTDVRAIVIINPGNPTGAVLSKKEISNIIEFAQAQRLVIIADEVYQTNVFVNDFHSSKKILCKMQADNLDKYAQIELASLHSISKGMIGEGGHRGGYFELVGFDPHVQAEVYKFVSIMLCAPVIIGVSSRLWLTHLGREIQAMRYTMKSTWASCQA
jgi:alanine transaminase